MSVAEAIREAATHLAETSDTARLDAELLMAHALGTARSDMLLRHMDAPAPDGFAALVERRAGHEPVAYITGEAEFYGLALSVTPDTLIPRGDSETLIEAAREHFETRSSPRSVLDLGTGSGALLIAALSLWPEARGCAVDRSAKALAVARANAERYYRGRDVAMCQGDWTKPSWATDLGQFDLILCNPPYVETDAALDRDVREFEPSEALFAGAEGLDDYRVLIPQLRALMAPNALAVLEIGAGQSRAVTAIAEAAGFSAKTHRDLANRPRAVVIS